MRLLTVALFAGMTAPAFAAALTAPTVKDCGVYTVSDQPPGALLVKIETDGFRLIDQRYNVFFEITDDAAVGFQWARPDADTFGLTKVRWEGHNLVLDMAEAQDLEEEEVPPTEFHRAVYLPFCPGV